MTRENQELETSEVSTGEEAVFLTENELTKRLVLNPLDSVLELNQSYYVTN